MSLMSLLALMKESDNCINKDRVVYDLLETNTITDRADRVSMRIMKVIL